MSSRRGALTTEEGVIKKRCFVSSQKRGVNNRRRVFEKKTVSRCFMSSLFANAVPDKSRKVCRLSAFCAAAAARTRGRRFLGSVEGADFLAVSYGLGFRV